MITDTATQLPHNDAQDDAYWDLQFAERESEVSIETGTAEQFEALSDEQKAIEWDRFHRLNAEGVGSDSYFYRVLMAQWQVGYVGH